MQHVGNVMVSLYCQATGGTSGGPVFVETSGGWYVGGVANKGYPNAKNVEWLHSAYFDGRIIDFWNDVFG